MKTCSQQKKCYTFSELYLELYPTPTWDDTPIVRYDTRLTTVRLYSRLFTQNHRLHRGKGANGGSGLAAATAVETAVATAAATGGAGQAAAARAAPVGA